MRAVLRISRLWGLTDRELRAMLGGATPRTLCAWREAALGRKPLRLPDEIMPMLTAHQTLALMDRLPAGTNIRSETAGTVFESSGWAVVLLQGDAAGNHAIAGPFEISSWGSQPTEDLRAHDFRDKIRAALVGIVRFRP